MSGIGKTTICKVLCNKFFDEFCGRVCHIELKSLDEQLKETHEKELLQKVLTSFTNNDEFLHKLKDVTQVNVYYPLLRREVVTFMESIIN